MPESQSLATEARALYEREILKAEGAHHVGGVYYANAFDADQQRRWAAERMVREAARATECARPAAALANSRARDRDTRPTVTTLLTPRERQRVEIATAPHVALTHRETIAGIRADLTTGRALAALVSAGLVTASDVPALTCLAQELPTCGIVGLVADTDEAHALAGTLRLGQAGVTELVDGRTAAGWEALRTALVSAVLPSSTFQRDAVDTVISDLSGRSHSGASTLPTGTIRFFRALFSPHITTAEQLADTLGVPGSTLMSRFYRRALPAPKRYIMNARLVWAAHLGESPALSFAKIALRLDASSPQSLNRTVHTLTGLTGSQFRAAFTGSAMLERFRAAFVLPYRETFRTFDPLRPLNAPRATNAAAPAPTASASAASTPTNSLGNGRAA